MKEQGTSRRDVLKLASAAVPAAAVAVASTAAPAVAAEAPAAGKGLRVTEHTKKYWETARY